MPRRFALAVCAMTCGVAIAMQLASAQARIERLIWRGTRLWSFMALPLRNAVIVLAIVCWNRLHGWAKNCWTQRDQRDHSGTVGRQATGLPHDESGHQRDWLGQH